VDLFCVCVFCGSVIVRICVCAFGRYSLVFVFLLSFGVCDDLWICFVFVFFVDLSRVSLRGIQWIIGVFVVFWCL